MKKNIIFMVVVLLSLFMGGCKYDFIIPEEVPVIDNGGEPISFATQIAPIFSTADKCTACHKSGGTANPDLSAANAYAQLSSKYVNTGAPAESLILTIPGPATATHAWKKFSQTEAAIILAWITEGAKNN